MRFTSLAAMIYSETSDSASEVGCKDKTDGIIGVLEYSEQQ